MLANKTCYVFLCVFTAGKFQNLSLSLLEVWRREGERSGEYGPESRRVQGGEEHTEFDTKVEKKSGTDPGQVNNYPRLGN